jgi:hypothetical protein
LMRMASYIKLFRPLGWSPRSPDTDGVLAVFDARLSSMAT